jgi:hypothetical protein
VDHRRDTNGLSLRDGGTRHRAHGKRRGVRGVYDCLETFDGKHSEVAHEKAAVVRVPGNEGVRRGLFRQSPYFQGNISHAFLVRIPHRRGVELVPDAERHGDIDGTMLSPLVSRQEPSKDR